MDRDRFATVRRLFDRALDRPPEQREAFVRDACGSDAELSAELLSLLSHETGEDRADPLAGLAARLPALLPTQDLSGADVAGFRIVRRIGSGGMGTVYEAEQLRPRRRVAWKTLATPFPDARARQRFEDEIELLARLRHPGIAQVLEAGTWRAGELELPWFAMELVEDPRPIDRYVRDAELAPRAVAGLFRQVCEAVHSAHQRGVLHRDLKPANVLVDRHGRPKVIDFGVARLLDADDELRRTRTGELLGTLAYMSPERLELGAAADTTTVDVYALGVILYELLAGSPPFGLDGLPPARAVDVLRGCDVPAPSRVAGRELSRELDWIVLKAAAREPGDRYVSAAELASDLERFDRDEVVAAGPPSTGYRLRKAARRHRALLVATGVVVAALVAGLVVASLGWRRVAAAERVARREVATLAAVNGFQQRILRGVYSDARGRDVRLADVVDAAAAELTTEPLEDPGVEVGLRTSLGISYLGLGLLREAEAQLVAARALASRPEVSDDARIALHNDLGVVYERLGQLDDAERELQTSLSARLARYGSDHAETATARHNLVSVLLQLGRADEALRCAQLARDTFVRLSGDADPASITARSSLAMALAATGRLDAADAEFEGAWADAQAYLHPDHPARLASMSQRAVHLRNRGRVDDYVRAMVEVAAARERVLGPGHPDTLVALNNLAVGRQDLGDLPGAEAVLREIIAARHAVGIDAGVDVVGTAQNLTSTVRRQGRLAEAEQLARDNLALATRSLPAGHWLTAVVTKELGACLREAGRLAEAEPLLLAAHASLDAQLGPADRRTQKVVEELATLYDAMERPADAAAWRARLSR
ncbi:MAG: serine/threonine protein kinase [Planctomycetes bacterium]|nr:serine/threonine protein kinase [Planctomycetota bacterium]